jgi:hypothetical protein
VSTLRVSGLDLSITATGVCHTAVGDRPGCTHLISPKGKDSRLVTIRNLCWEYVRGSELVLIEGFLQKSFSAGTTGMVHGAVRAMLLSQGIPYATMAPTGLKKYATGSGGASKTDMAVAAFKRAGTEFTNDNECDAWWLWVAVNDHLGQPVFSLPAVNRESLSKIEMGG